MKGRYFCTLCRPLVRFESMGDKRRHLRVSHSEIKATDSLNQVRNVLDELQVAIETELDRHHE